MLLIQTLVYVVATLVVVLTLMRLTLMNLQLMTMVHVYMFQRVGLVMTLGHLIHGVTVVVVDMTQYVMIQTHLYGRLVILVSNVKQVTLSVLKLKLKYGMKL